VERGGSRTGTFTYRRDRSDISIQSFIGGVKEADRQKGNRFRRRKQKKGAAHATRGKRRRKKGFKEKVMRLFTALSRKVPKN